MKVKLLACLICLTTLYNCTSQPSVTALCERDSKGNYILKWEIYPDIDNIPAEIFVSDNDTTFPSTPYLTVRSNDYIAMINNKSDSIEKRKFFRIKIGGTMSNIFTNRFFEMDSIQNFRDIGGYITNDNRTIRWGKVFRSGSFTMMTSHDSAELSTLGIKTIIDIRPKDMTMQYLDRFAGVNGVRIPISEKGYRAISQEVLDGRFLRGDAVIYTQDTYRDMIYNFTDDYAKFFDYLCDEKNYPIVFHCYLGKDQSGLATYFLLRALDVPIDVIEDDYMCSAMGIDRNKLIKDADTLTESRQEAFTMLTKTDLSYLKYGISCIREKSGSVDEYMLNELKLTPEKRKKLQEILLH